MPPWTRTRLSCSSAPGLGRGVLRAEDRGGDGMSRPRLTPNSGSPSPARTPVMSFIPGQTPPESCQPPPEPPSHSPRSARARTRRRSSSSSAPSRDRAWPVARMQADDQGREERGRDGQARALRDVVHRAHELEPEAGADHPGQQVGQALPRPLDAGRDDARGDDRGLEQAQVVLGEVEDLGEARHVGGGPEVDAGQAQDRLLDDAEVGLDRRARGVVAAVDAEVHRDVQDLARPRGSPCRGRRCRSSRSG